MLMICLSWERFTGATIAVPGSRSAAKPHAFHMNLPPFPFAGNERKGYAEWETEDPLIHFKQLWVALMKSSKNNDDLRRWKQKVELYKSELNDVLSKTP